MLSRGFPDFKTRVLKGEVGHEPSRPFQRARPNLRRGKKPSTPLLATPVALPEVPIVPDPSEEGGRKRKREEHSVDNDGNTADFVDQDALSLEEPVQLMFEEAFFLSYVLGCLEVVTPDLVRPVFRCM